ncbi:MAG: hypothetical protein H6671_14910 [Anaerolineaceae bacterium]|nr:hypothetical protein [Anaerolineaceae bacterium]
MNPSQSPQEYFRLLLLTVVGQAFGAAGYELDERPVQWAGGQFRFAKMLDSGQRAVIEFQLLAYTDTEYAARNPSRFRVTLSRGNGLHRTLSALVVEDFGVAILPSADHWWTFADTETLGRALAEAGHLIVGYGLPWLAGELTPPLG